MLNPFSMRNRLRLPSRIALLLGLSALSAAGAKADTAEAQAGHEPARVPQQSVRTFGDLLIWSEAGRIYVAESGKEARELPLGDTPESRRLHLLLERQGATAQTPRAVLDRIILVGGGGEGFHWGPAPRPDARDRTAEPAPRAADKPSDPGPTPPVGQAGVTEKPGSGSSAPKK